MRKQYRKKSTETVTAVQLDLDTEGFSYEKWGGAQFCKPGDWLVNNNGDVYTIDRQTFADSYEQLSQGCYAKTGTVWAEVAEADGTVSTKEGSTDYRTGDYLVSNDMAGTDSYAVSREKFEEMYEPAEGQT